MDRVFHNGRELFRVQRQPRYVVRRGLSEVVALFLVFFLPFPLAFDRISQDVVAADDSDEQNNERQRVRMKEVFKHGGLYVAGLVI